MEPDGDASVKALHFPISIHGLRVEPDNKTMPHGNTNYGISIHGLRVEPDAFFGGGFFIIEYFNPRAPCGARHISTVQEL